LKRGSRSGRKIGEYKRDRRAIKKSKISLFYQREKNWGEGN